MNLDPRHDRMISALYGELTAGEQRDFEAEIAHDPELREEWEELRRTRMLLEEALDEPTARRRSAEPAGRSWRRTLLHAAAGFAAAACVFLVLLVSGLRIDRSDGGMLVRLDGDPEVLAYPIAADDAPLTRAEFEYFARSLVDATAARIDDLERRQTQAQSASTRALYEALSSTQEQQYSDLVYRIETAVPVRYDGGRTWPHIPTQEGPQQ